MLHAISLGTVVFGLWLLLSGFFVPLLLGLGVASCIAVVLIAHRMDVIDHEAQPVHLTSRAVFYFPWLMWEIVKSSIDIAKVVLDPRLPIRRRIMRVPAHQGDDLGRVVYANSITLTPGTVTVDTEGTTLVVHCVTETAAAGLASGDMGRRVAAMVGAPPPSPPAVPRGGT